MFPTWARGVLSALMVCAVTVGATQYGLHMDATYDGDGVRRGKQVQAARSVGAQISRNSLAWYVIERSRGIRDWTFTDNAVNELGAAGIEPMFTIYSSPSWANGVPSSVPSYMMYVPQESAKFDAWIAEYSAFIREAVRRYKGKVKKWEIGNEPNEYFFWKVDLANPNKGAPDSQQFIKWYRALYAAIRQEYPEAQIGAGGFTGLFASCWINGSKFIADLCDSGAPLDFVGVHPYSDHAPEVFVQWQGNFTDIQAVRDLLLSKGRPGIQLWVSEWGWPTDRFTLQQQADWVKRSLEMIRDRYPFVSAACYFVDYDRGEYFHGLFNQSFQPKLSATVFANFIKSLQALAPTITAQPVSRTATVGQSATFAVSAAGTAPLSYQWQKNGLNISGATGASYTTPPATAADNGASFRVLVSNSAGSVTSNSASLVVGSPPTITAQPVSRTATAGQSATFAVSAAGTAPLSYQWQRNGGNIAGAIGASYTVAATTLADNGSAYRCLVTNPHGTAASNSALLSVVPTSAGGSGLRGDYYDNLDFSGRLISRVDPTLNFNWGNGAPDSLLAPDTFSVRWTGQVQAQFSESYTFYTVSDDGVRLWVNGRQLVNNWTVHASVENSATISLVAGQRYDIRLEYYENFGAAVARLLWSSPSTPKQTIPQGQLFAPASTGEEVYLSDLTWSAASNGYGPIERDRSNGEFTAGDGRVITLNGVSYAKGLGVHALSDIRYSLAGQYVRFSSDIGVDDESGSLGSVVFEVWLDGVKAYASGTLTGSSATQSVVLDVSGKNDLRLVVTDADNRINNDHADWADARLRKAPVSAGGTVLAVEPAADSGSAAQSDSSPLTGQLQIDKLRASVRTGNPGKDACCLIGTIEPLAGDDVLAGEALHLDIAGARVSFALDRTGRGRSSAGSLVIRRNQQGTLSFKAILRHSALAEAWVDERVLPKTEGTANFSITISSSGGVSYVALETVRFTGAAKGVTVSK